MALSSEQSRRARCASVVNRSTCDLKRGPFNLRTAINALIKAAIRAPSGDNTQPWRFVVNESQRTITLMPVPGRDPSPMNVRQRMTRIAIGAALENMLRTAAHNGLKVELDDDNPSAVVVRLADCDRLDLAVQFDEAILARVTNRRVYQGRAVPPEALATLESELTDSCETATRLIVGTHRLATLAEIVGRADEVMFGAPTMRRAFLANVRFDAPFDAEVEEGLSLASLELSIANRLALRILPSLPQWTVRLMGIPRTLRRNAVRLVQSSAGVALVVAHDRADESDVAVGRAMQRAWLALCARGLAVQPMMSLPVLDNALENGSSKLLATLGQARVQSLMHELRMALPEIGHGRPAALLRFGYASPPSGRTGRLPLESVSEDAAPVLDRQPARARRCE